MRFKFRDGLEETVIATIMKQVRPAWLRLLRRGATPWRRRVASQRGSAGSQAGRVVAGARAQGPRH
jgi:hypothetical protein